MEFLTTTGVSHHLERLIINAKEQLIFVTPFLKFPRILYERIRESADAGVNITFIYGKEELSKEQEHLLKSLKNVKIYFLENLHAKCYLNENSGIISSMNLYDFSERNNREMGISFLKEDNASFYNQVLSEINSIRIAAKPIIESEFRKKPILEASVEKPKSYSIGLLEQLKAYYPELNFVYKPYNESIICSHFGDFFYLEILPKQSDFRINFSVRGRSVNNYRLLRQNEYKIKKLFPEDVLFWGSQMNRIKLDFAIEKAQLNQVEYKFFLDYIKSAKTLFESILTQ